MIAEYLKNRHLTVEQFRRFDTLFGDLYIGKNPTPKRNSYFVVRFSFSGIDTTSVEGFKVSFNAKIEVCVKEFLTHYEEYISVEEVKNYRLQTIDSMGKMGVQTITSSSPTPVKKR